MSNFCILYYFSLFSPLSDWIERQKQIQKDKMEAQKRAKMLEDLDDEFGVGNLVQEEVITLLVFP